MADKLTQEPPIDQGQDPSQESRLSVRAERDRLREERDALQRQLDELNASMGKDVIDRAIHYRRTNDPAGVCRPGRVLGPADERGWAHIRFGQLPVPPQTDPKTGQPVERDKITFDVSRPQSPMGEVETWHLAEECPFHNTVELREAAAPQTA